MPEVARADMQAGWTTVSLGDVAEVINDYWDRDTTIPERLVAGEHIDEGDMRIRRWGMTDDDLIPPTFNRRFQARDALLHSRNIDKVAQPDFDGITGEKIFILRSKDEDSLLQELIPYLVGSDHFRKYAESRWAGSTNKFLNKTPLMQYEFALPPLEEQRRLAEILQAAEGVTSRARRAIDRLRIARAAVEIELIAKPLGLDRSSLHLQNAKPDGNWVLLTGQELLDSGHLVALQDGNHGSQYPRSSELGDDGIPYIAASDISNDGDINLQECRRIQPERASALRIPPARSGDVILTNNATVGRVTLLPEWPTAIVASTSTTYYRCNPDLLDPEYLRWFFESAVFQFQLSTIMRQSTRNQVPITTQKRLLFAVPPLDQQHQLAAQRNQFLSARRSCQSRVEQSIELKRALMEAVL